MKKSTFLTCVFCFLLGFGAFAQSQDQNRQAKTKDNISEQEMNIIRKAIHSRMPAKKDLSSVATKAANQSDNGVKTPLEVPEDMVFPIESDEVQAILMTWFYNTYTVSGNEPAEQLLS